MRLDHLLSMENGKSPRAFRKKRSDSVENPKENEEKTVVQDKRLLFNF